MNQQMNHFHILLSGSRPYVSETVTDVWTNMAYITNAIVAVTGIIIAITAAVKLYIKIVKNSRKKREKQQQDVNHPEENPGKKEEKAR